MMSLIDFNSWICVKNEHNIFRLPPTQTSIEDGIVVDYHPIASLVDSGTIEFDIPASVEYYLDLALVYLHLAVKLRRTMDLIWKMPQLLDPPIFFYIVYILKSTYN